MSKKMFFVSNGRCGTKSIQKLLNEKLGSDFIVVHQVRGSRIANVVGNLMYSLGECELAKKGMFNKIFDNYFNQDDKFFISSDPLTAMIIPQKYVKSDKVAIVQIVRDSESFADSFLNIIKKRPTSFIAHTLIPFWQIGIFPLENLFSSNIRKKYISLNKLKNKWFAQQYSRNDNYVTVAFEDLFKEDNLAKVVNYFFGTEIKLSPKELAIKSNASK
ncbi:hypothetical protein ACFLZK_00580 [Patescibacteria group bacterium]